MIGNNQFIETVYYLTIPKKLIYNHIKNIIMETKLINLYEKSKLSSRNFLMCNISIHI